MLQFTQATPNHTEQIVELLKASLGEQTTKKSAAFWNWKHNQNPFGTSTTILAFDDNNLVGVRAFMKWKFQNQNKTITCGRAVDTAVHPNAQGKGIFTKLTLATIDECKKEDINLIFNTPNKISKIGYLKMGWVENKPLPIQVTLGSIFPKKYNDNFINTIYKNYHFNVSSNFNFQFSNFFTTTLNFDFIKWRYIDCPVNKYAFLYDENNFLIVVRCKNIRGFIELRICDIHIENNQSALNKSIKKFVAFKKLIKPLIITSAKNDLIPKEFYKKIGLTFTINKGPKVTLRKVSDNNDLEHFNDYKNWQPSLGCMELF